MLSLKLNESSRADIVVRISLLQGLRKRIRIISYFYNLTDTYNYSALICICDASP